MGEPPLTTAQLRTLAGGRMDELPPYVTYINDAIERLSQSFQQALDRMATKDQLDTLRVQLAQERDARERLETDLEHDEQQRNTKMQRLWAGIWGVGAAVAAVVIANLLTVMHL